jgi:hypothetical protein
MLALSLAAMIVATTCGGVATAASVVSNTYVLLDNRLTVQWSVSNATTNESNATTIAPNTTTITPNTTTIAPNTTTIAPNTTTIAPNTTTITPNTTTITPNTTTITPNTTTIAPNTTTIAPATTTNVPNAMMNASTFTTVVFTLQRSGTSGWVGVGFADSGMNGSIVVCHVNVTNSSCGNFNGNDHNPTRQNTTTVQLISSSINSTTNQFRTTFSMNTSDFGIKNGTQRMIVAFGNWNDAIDFPLKHAPDTRTPLLVDIFAGTMTTTVAPAPTTTRPATFAPNTTLNVTTTVPATSAPTTTAPETNAADDGGDDGFSGTQIAIVIIVILIVVALCICGAVYYFKKKGKASAVAGGAAGHHPRNAGGRAVNYGAEMDEVGAAAH